MPFTPFHFGPGLLTKAVFPRWLSWTSFCAAQVVIDVEPLVHILGNDPPLHRFFHTLLGATVAGVVTSGAMLAGMRVWARGWPELESIRARKVDVEGEFSRTGIVVGAVIGGLSHPLLDGLMHADVRPFAPWSEANPWLGAISISALHLSCLVTGLVGAAIVGYRMARTTPAV